MPPTSLTTRLLLLGFAISPIACHEGRAQQRPGEGRQPTLPTPSITEYRPQSTLVVPEHTVPRARFPVVDIHGHPPTLDNLESIERVVSEMERLNIGVMVQARPSSGARLQSQIDAVREVLAEIEAAKIPELIVINKIDAADPVVLNRIMRRERNVIGVSAKTGEGIEELLKAIEVNLPGPSVEVRAVVPYTRGDLVSRILEDGVVFEREHREDGTYVHAKVDDELAADLAEYAE